MSRQKDLYYLPVEIQIKEHDINEVSLGWYSKLLTHEIAGLESLGCNITIYPKWIVVSKTESILSPFYNRVINLRASQEDFIKFLHATKEDNVRAAIVVNSFTLPKNNAEILSAFGAHHTLSSIVLGKHPEKPHHQPSTTGAVIYDLRHTPNKWPQALTLFMQFFAKNQEPIEEAERRMIHNIRQGPHFLATTQGEPVGLIGSVVFGDTASIYAAAVSEHHRSTNTLDTLSWQLSSALYEQEVEFVYLKSRNKGAIGYARKLQGFKYLYTERVYEI